MFLIAKRKISKNLHFQKIILIDLILKIRKQLI